MVSNHKHKLYLHNGFSFILNMLLNSTEMNIKFMEVFKKSAERSTFRHLCKCVDILRETLAAIAKLTVWTRNVCVGVIDVARKKHARMYLAPVTSHLFAIFTASIEIWFIRHFE